MNQMDIGNGEAVGIEKLGNDEEKKVNEEGVEDEKGDEERGEDEDKKVTEEEDEDIKVIEEDEDIKVIEEEDEDKKVNEEEYEKIKLGKMNQMDIGNGEAVGIEKLGNDEEKKVNEEGVEDEKGDEERGEDEDKKVTEEEDEDIKVIEEDEDIKVIEEEDEDKKLTSEAYRKRFREMMKVGACTFAETARDLERLYQKWIEADRVGSYTDLKQLMVMEKFLEMMHPKTKFKIQEAGIKELRHAADRGYMITEAYKRFKGKQSEE
ncbi:high mobility group nucleosome-binding domain-containing protein 5-like [Procambarus clarkii]|uniref:high mobility group nucleosome-binding domain-containing protein 5-like n=1 Tax=Procambarus clarkii TaxID=6728 RepID=UPI003742686C